MPASIMPAPIYPAPATSSVESMATLTKTLKKTGHNGGGAQKRKRTGSPDLESESPDSSSRGAQQKSTRDGPKKKKANRACFHCQKSHLTCDDCASYIACFEIADRSKYSPARPCQRCVKRGIADSCTEGHRKKAKYLLDDDELGKSLRKIMY
jgi:hypothetical protein